MSSGSRDKLVPYARGRLCYQCNYYYANLISNDYHASLISEDYYASLVSNDYYASLVSNDYHASLISNDYYASLVSKAHIDVQFHHNPRASFRNKNYVFNIDHEFKNLLNHIKYDLNPHLSDLVHHFENLDVSRCPRCSTHLCRQSWDILWHNPHLWRQEGLPKERCELLPASGGLPQPGR
jgi:hypothetical protein